MSRGVIPLTMALVVTSVLAITGTASATTFCVGVPDPGCVAQGTVQTALNAAAADTATSSIVELGPGTLPEDNLHYPAPSLVGHTVEIDGSAGEPTILSHSVGDPHPVFECSGGALTLHRVQVRTPSGAPTAGVTGDTPCALTLDGVTVDATQGTGIAVGATGTLTVRASTLTASATAPAVNIATAQASSIADSTLTGATGLVDLGPAAVAAHRLTLGATGAGNAGVIVQGAASNAALTIDDSLIRTASGATALRAISGTSASRTAAITARQITAVAGDASTATPFWAHSDLGTAAISVLDSVASGYPQGVWLEGAGTAANIDLHHTVLTSPATPGVATGSTTYTHTDDVLDIATHPPLFVSAAAGNFHLGSTSTLLDEDATPLAAGESSTDIAGHARIVGTKRDLGAIEHQVPTVSATVPAGGKMGEAVAFAGAGASDAGVTNFGWTFGDGAGAGAASPTHAYALPGTYHWTLLVGDGRGTTASAAGTITITAVPPSVVWLAPDAITDTSAVLHGTVNPMGGVTTYHFDYGPTASYGQQSTQVAIGAGTTSVAASGTLVGLAGNHVYHARLVAVQGATAVAGSDQTFTTLPAAAPKSADGASSTPTPTTKTTNAAGATRCKVPRLTGKTIAQARKALTKAHCRLGTIKRRRMRTHHGRVVLQQHSAGRSYARNTRVGITVGK